MVGFGDRPMTRLRFIGKLWRPLSFYDRSGFTLATVES
jgi:hypothetical protein